MKATHTLLGAMIAAGSLVPAMAEPLTVYGKANLSAQLADEGEGSFTELKSNASRFGVKGETALENGLEVFYQIEWQVDLADLSGDDNIKSRDQYVGVRGDFGSLYAGRANTVLKNWSKPVDLFNDYEADLKGLWKGENRVSDSVNYISPSFGGFTFGINYMMEDDVDGEDGVTVGVHYGDAKLKKSAFYAAVLVEQDMGGYDTQRVIVSTKLDSVTLGAALHSQEPAAGGDSKNGYLVSAQYGLDAWKFKLQYQTLEDDNSVSIGADYKLGKNTKAYAWYTDRSLDQSEDKSWLAVGLEHKF
ncbi:porin [Aestuariibacter halophilus]|uniref:Porin n=1 Tax=Fluctibacter halophilus TaxID=226011 RepID=A0ABS8GBW8_9ALTE|nr:porin [Aestuariibacter halophilus]MCC2618074.1 porin [Aestuariibacter halophilus]